MQIKAIIFDIFGVFYKQKFLLLGSYDEGMISLVNNLKDRGIRVFALSNSFGEFLPLKDCFDKIYFCNEIGFYKPDFRALKFLLEKENLKPEDCLYFDDTRENIEMGERAGIKSFLFESGNQVKNIIESFLE